MKTIPKKLSDSYLYGIGGYEQKLYKFFVESTTLTKQEPGFEDIRYDVKRGQNSTALLKAFDSNNVVFLTHNVALPRSFKVFAASDIKSGDNKTKIFIDVTGVINNVNGKYIIKPNDLDKFISYLMTALAYLIYYADADRITNNSKLLETGTKAFAELFTYAIDSLRIGGVDKLREKVLYLSAMYYQINILRKDPTESADNRAKKVSGLSVRDIEMLNILLDGDTYKDIFHFIQNISKVIRAEGLKLDNFVEKWIFVFGSGTQFALELYPAFSSLVTNAYCGAYLNNQKVIEKILGRTLVEYSVALLQLGSDLR